MLSYDYNVFEVSSAILSGRPATYNRVVDAGTERTS